MSTALVLVGSIIIIVVLRVLGIVPIPFYNDYAGNPVGRYKCVETLGAEKAEPETIPAVVIGGWFGDYYLKETGPLSVPTQSKLIFDSEKSAHVTTTDGTTIGFDFTSYYIMFLTIKPPTLPDDPTPWTKIKQYRYRWTNWN